MPVRVVPRLRLCAVLLAVGVFAVLFAWMGQQLQRVRYRRSLVTKLVEEGFRVGQLSRSPMWLERLLGVTEVSEIIKVDVPVSGRDGKLFMRGREVDRQTMIERLSNLHGQLSYAGIDPVITMDIAGHSDSAAVCALDQVAAACNVKTDRWRLTEP